jgi:hypothetical protein
VHASIIRSGIPGKTTAEEEESVEDETHEERDEP